MVKIKIDQDKDPDVKIRFDKDRNSQISIALEIRKSLDGNLLIFDHEEIDIAILLDKNKIVSFPKGEFGDSVYAAQNRLMEFLLRRGIIPIDGIKGGNVYGSLESKMLESKVGLDKVDMVLLNISQFMDAERPTFAYEKSYEENEVDRYTHPDEEDSTELGEVPQSEKKGSITPYQTRRYAGGIAGV